MLYLNSWWLCIFPYIASSDGKPRTEKQQVKRSIRLLPLNGRRWLRSDVVCYAVNASNFANDARRNAG